MKDDADKTSLNDEVAPVVESTAKAVKAPMSRKKRLIIIGVVALVAIVALLAWYFVGTKKQQNVTVTPTPDTTVKTPSKEALVDPSLQRFITPTTGETWLASPKDMSPQGWIQTEYRDYYEKLQYDASKIDEMMQQMKPAYKEVGSRAGNTIIMVVVSSDEPGGPFYLLFEKRPDGSVAVIAYPQSTQKYYDNHQGWLSGYVAESKGIVVDTSTHYDSLSIPLSIAMDDGEAVTAEEYLDSRVTSDSNDVTRTKILDLGKSALYRAEREYLDTKLTNIGYEIHMPIGTTVNVKYAPNNESLEKYTFDNGTIPTVKNYDGSTQFDRIHAVARGCGGNQAAVTRSSVLKDSDLIAIGKTDTGRTVYSLKDHASTLAQKAFDEAQLVRGTPVSEADFWDNHALMIIKNAAGENLVYVRDHYGLVGGCAKPVVYLYPTIARSVDVQVGADVSISDPIYPVGGWRSVWAEPSGKLAYQGGTYESLFWEGTGYGSYPGITSGTVVKRADAEATIRRQLSEQGLNAKESADFMDFWAAKIPSKPYIRLTWLTTEQMDTLAPLRIVPRPDTVKRVFLDMDGYDTKISLPTQKLSSFTRRGFTVVEWGGLTSEIRH
ncbi:MAG: hypothetical protein WAT17_01975 [Candidatus Saccharimonadales bacterium]|jgi:hypothetical protein